MPGLSRGRSFWLCIALLALSAGWGLGVPTTRVVAQSADGAIDKAIVDALKWRSIGPIRGGRSIAVSGVKGRPKEAYFGAVGGGLWKTTDGGVSWTPVTDGQIKSSSVGAVAVSESNPDVVYIGMGESCIRGNIMPGDGVYKSTDAGKTWTHVGFSRLATRSRRSASTPPTPTSSSSPTSARYGKDERRARRLQEHRRRQDAGRKCCSATPRPAPSTSRSIARIPNVMFAALWEAYRVEYQMSSGGPGSGLFKSTDGGDTWTEITRNPGLPRASSARSASRSRAPIPIASTRWSKTRRAASSALTMRARPGSW